jgi:membrane protein implicated in regulation of membrane protease activity
MAGVGASAIAALVVGGPMWELQVFLDVSLLLYVVLLVVAKRRRAEVVRDLRSVQSRRERADEPRFLEPLQAGGRGN